MDNGVEAYFAELAKTDFFAFINKRCDSLEHDHGVEFWNSIKEDSIFLKVEQDSVFLKIETDTTKFKTKIGGFSQILDSGKGPVHVKNKDSGIVSVFQGKGSIDSLSSLQGLANKLVVSITRNEIDFARLDTVFSEELGRKNIRIGYQIKHLRQDSTVGTFRSKRQ